MLNKLKKVDIGAKKSAFLSLFSRKENWDKKCELEFWKVVFLFFGVKVWFGFPFY